MASLEAHIVTSDIVSADAEAEWAWRRRRWGWRVRTKAVVQKHPSPCAQDWYRTLRRIIRVARPTWYAYENAVATYTARGLLTGPGDLAVSSQFAIEPRDHLLRFTVYSMPPRSVTRAEAAALALAVAEAARAVSIRCRHDPEGARVSLEAVAVIDGPQAATAATRIMLRDMQRVLAHDDIAPFFVSK